MCSRTLIHSPRGSPAHAKPPGVSPAPHYAHHTLYTHHPSRIVLAELLSDDVLVSPPCPARPAPLLARCPDPACRQTEVRGSLNGAPTLVPTFETFQDGQAVFKVRITALSPFKSLSHSSRRADQGGSDKLGLAASSSSLRAHPVARS